VKDDTYNMTSSSTQPSQVAIKLHFCWLPLQSPAASYQCPGWREGGALPSASGQASGGAGMTVLARASANNFFCSATCAAVEPQCQ
jgi:hypothetical protein